MQNEALKGISPDELSTAISVLSRMKDNLESIAGAGSGAKAGLPV